MNHAVFVFAEDKIIRQCSYYDTATIRKRLGFKMMPVDGGREGINKSLSE